MKKILLALSFSFLSVFAFAATKVDLLSKRFLPSLIQNVDANFTSGSITLKADFVEHVSVEISGDEGAAKPTVKLTNGTLTVKTPLFSSPKKRHYITIKVPYGLELNNISIVNAAANSSISNISAESLNITTASGKMDITDSVFKDYIKLAGASGKISLSNVESPNLTSSCVSGQVTAEKCITNAFRMETTSGKLDLQNIQASFFEIQATSGEINLSLDKMISESSFARSNSGKINLTFPENSGYTVTVNTISGNFTDENTSLSASHCVDLVSSFGDGAVPVKLNSISGSITISLPQ